MERSGILDTIAVVFVVGMMAIGIFAFVAGVISFNAGMGGAGLYFLASSIFIFGSVLSGRINVGAGTRSGPW